MILRIPLSVKHLVKIALSRTISEIKVFLQFMQKFKIAAKNGGKTVWQKLVDDSACTLGEPKIFRNRPISCRSEIKCVFDFYVLIEEGRKKMAGK